MNKPRVYHSSHVHWIIHLSYWRQCGISHARRRALALPLAVNNMLMTSKVTKRIETKWNRSILSSKTSLGSGSVCRRIAKNFWKASKVLIRRSVARLTLTDERTQTKIEESCVSRRGEDDFIFMDYFKECIARGDIYASCLLKGDRPAPRQSQLSFVRYKLR